MISSSVTGGNEDNEGVCLEEMTGRGAAAVEEPILVTLSLKNAAKFSAVNFVDKSSLHERRGLFPCSLTVVVQNELTLFWQKFR